ncbi:type II toxin-antitoxin system Phd/YefM family antitoxin [Flexivirga meconopsidis]|uniref:type II toxin-antitoxin system Phd/YefM family antitoxin n=1 Tax=Flexivirga meconopsidis TaxID=2977121 RepID=UPI002240DA82|nr:type II toxin-antitoxin system prevent-host-death family antitoxin [Flexivirga meconopsidis]
MAISVSTARQTLPRQLDRVEAGEEIEITRHGKVVAVLVRPDTLRTRRRLAARDASDRLAARLDLARTEPLGEPVIDAERADELVDAMQKSRSRR